MIKLKELRMGETKCVRVLVKKVEEKTGASGKPFLTVTFTDGETTMQSNKFDSSAFPYEGKVVDMTLEYKPNGFINIKSSSPAYDAKVSDYIQSAPVDINRMLGDIEEEIDKMSRPDVKAVTKYIISKNRADLKTWAAAKSMHHNYRGGLLYHTWRMLRAGISVSEVYGADRTMLSAGIILHDIGKLKELKSDEFGTAEYSVEGNLFGHLYMGAEMIEEAANALGIDSDSKDIMMLKHLILSHHNKYEYGAVRRPATKEAFMLSMIDDMDSKIEQYEQETEKISVGECGSVPAKGLDVCVYRWEY